MGGCSPESNYYTYGLEKGSFYTLSFCLGGQTEGMSDGDKCATPKGIFSGACSICGEAFVDDRDGNSYETAWIGDQCWMTENLAYLPMVHNNSDYAASSTAGLPGYGIYGYDGDNVATAKGFEYEEFNMYETFGVLYNWYTVDEGNLCPEGWHVPSDNDFTNLERLVCTILENEGCEETFSYEGDPGWRGDNEGDALKSRHTHTWCNEEDGCEESNFNALPAGGRYSAGNFDDFGSAAVFWSSSEGGSDNAWDRGLYFGISSVARDSFDQSFGFSVRCLRNY
jgi:uncharacterized protein (TIGR02145 family)